MKKRLIALLLSLVALTFVLTACGNDDKSGDGNKDGKTTINVWGMGEEAKSLPEIAKKLKKKTRILK